MKTFLHTRQFTLPCSSAAAFLKPVPSGRAIRLHCVLAGAVVLVAGLASAAEEFSPAERALFMTDHLGSINRPTSFHYTFRKSGTLEQGFEDKVTVAMSAANTGRCCTAATEFLVGARRVKLPDIESPTGNPVILHFLERDIHEMQRLTKGQPNYFRKRIRMAVFQGARVADIKVPYGGTMVAAKQIEISPYADDPLKPRYEKLAGKQYVFTLSPAVPGGVYAIRTRVTGDTAPGSNAPLLLEEMTLDEAGARVQAPTGPTR